LNFKLSSFTYFSQLLKLIKRPLQQRNSWLCENIGDLTITSRFAWFHFPVVNFILLRRNTKHSRQCLTTFPNTSKFIKNIPFLLFGNVVTHHLYSWSTTLNIVPLLTLLHQVTSGWLKRYTNLSCGLIPLSQSLSLSYCCNKQTLIQ